MTRIVIAEDHTMVRYGTIQLLKQSLNETEISEATNFEQLLQLISQERFDLLILDINIPGGDNLQMIDVIRLRQPTLKILVYSGYDEQVFAIRYLQVGANGYIMKDASEEEIKDAVLTILKNDMYISTPIKQRLLMNLTEKKPGLNPLQTLSNREKEVMQQLIRGTALIDIARQLSLQISTVNTYKTRIFEKMEVNNVVELVHKIRFYENKTA